MNYKKKGSIVKIKSLEWFNKKNNLGIVIGKRGSCSFTRSMSVFCGMWVEITQIRASIVDDIPVYTVRPLNPYKNESLTKEMYGYSWEDWMFEEDKSEKIRFNTT